MKTSSCVTIADVSIEISCDDSLYVKNASSPLETGNHFQPVDVCQTGDIAVSISSQTTPPLAEKQIISGESILWQLYVHGQGFLDCRFHDKNPHMPYWWACIDRFYRKIDIGVNMQSLPSTASGHFEGIEADKFATDRKLMIPALLSQGVLVFHGAGGSVKGRGFVIAGTSGSGKSTLAKLLVRDGHPMFSDEAMAVRKKNDTTWLAYGTPWPSSAEIVRDESAPLAAMLFLRQAETSSLQRISSGQALEGILQFCSIPWYLPHLADKALTVCERLVAEIPMFELNCSLEDRPVETIERLAESL